MNEISVPIEVRNFQKFTTASTSTSSYSLTGYTLPLTPFTFVPIFEQAFLSTAIDNIVTEDSLASLIYFITTEGGDPLETEGTLTFVSNKKIVWDFGDGTFSNSLTATHVYETPGVYNINCFFYDASGNVYKNTILPSVTCFNIVEDTFNVSISSEYLTSGIYNLTAGKIINPFKITSQSSWQNVIGDNSALYGLSLLSGSKSFFEQKLELNKYGHLYEFSSFYDVVNNEFVEIEDITIERTPIYCALSSSSIPSLYFTTKENVSSIFCGVSGDKAVYVKDDVAGHKKITVFDKTLDVNNTLPITFNCTFSANTIADLAISSNGITGEGSPSSIFDIDSIKYVGQKINFIVTVKDSQYFTIRDLEKMYVGGSQVFPQITLSAFNSNNTPDNSLGVFETNFTYLSTISSCFYRGTFTPSVTADNIYIGAICNPTLSATSSSFTVYPSSGKYKIAKVNEDFDYSGTLNDLRLQEFLLDKTVMFDDFFGTIYGGASADPLSPGKFAYERIANFTSNEIDVYKSGIQSFLSLNEMYGGENNILQTTNFGSPSKIKRLVDLLSINHSRLWGSTNKYNENFNSYFQADSEKFALNLGNKLDFSTTVLTAADGFIVALEKFSNTYTKCSTFISFISTTCLNTNLSTYSLSSYNDTWGWGLTLYENITGIDITNYYDFYTFNNIVEGTHFNNVINFGDSNTTLNYTNSSYKDWIKNGGIIDEILDYALYTGVGVLST